MDKKRGILKWVWCLLAAFAASLLASALAAPLERMEYLFLDWHLRSTVAKGNDQKMALILGGDRSMIELGNWPWPRQTHAGLLDDQLAGAKTVAYDIFLVDKSAEEQDAALARAIAGHGNVVLGSVYRQDGVLLQPLARFRENAATGYLNYYPDRDYVMRRYPLARQAEQDGFSVFTPSFLYAVLEAAGQSPEIGAGGLRLAGANAAVPLGHDRAIFKFSVPGGAYPVYEFSDVVQGKVPAGAFEDAVVFVGISATGAADNIHTAEGYLAGTQVLADLYYILASGYMPVQPPLWGQVLPLAVVLALCMAAVTALPNRFNWLPPVLGLGLLVVAGHFLFVAAGVYLPGRPPPWCWRCAAFCSCSTCAWCAKTSKSRRCC